MATGPASAKLSGRFPPGTKVGLYRNRIDGVNRDPGLKDAFKTATVDKNGDVQFDGLDDDERLFIGAEVEEERPVGGGRWVSSSQWRVVGIHASVPKGERKRQSEREIREALSGTLSPDQRIPDRTTVGARGSRSLSASGQPFAHPATGKPTEGKVPSEPAPHLRQEDAQDVDQRSATITGTATPVDPDEQVPKPKQEEGIDLDQRSATALGELTPIPEGEVQPAVPQVEDGVDREQRSATPHGEQTPVPTGDAVENQRRKDSSQAKAEGAVIPPVEKAPQKASKARSRSQKRKTTPRSTRKSKPRTEAQKAARRKRDAARKAKK